LLAPLKVFGYVTGPKQTLSLASVRPVTL